jgi:hypothetical protein
MTTFGGKMMPSGGRLGDSMPRGKGERLPPRSRARRRRRSLAPADAARPLGYCQADDGNVFPGVRLRSLRPSMTPNAQRSLWESNRCEPRSRQRSAETNALRLEHMCFGVQSLRRRWHPTADARASLSPTFLECSPESGMMMNQRLRRVRPESESGYGSSRCCHTN